MCGAEQDPSDGSVEKCELIKSGSSVGDVVSLELTPLIIRSRSGVFLTGGSGPGVKVMGE